MKIIKSLGNRGVLLKGTTGKFIDQKEGFIGSLIRAGLPLMKNVLIPLANNILLLVRVIASASATDEAIPNKIWFIDKGCQWNR